MPPAGCARIRVEWAEHASAIRLPARIKQDQPGSSTPSRTATQETDIPGIKPLPSAPPADGPGSGAKPAFDDTQHGLPINLAAALQLAGVSPLDIAAATVQVKQGLRCCSRPRFSGSPR